MTNKMFAELTFSSQGNGDEDVKKILNFFLKEFKSGDKLNLSLNKMTLEVLFKEVPPVDFIKSMFEHARIEKLTIAPTKGAGEAEQETAETETEQETAETEAEQEVTETEAEQETTETETEQEATETEAEQKAEAEAEKKAEEKTATPLKKRGRPRKKAAVTEQKAEEVVEISNNFPILRGQLGLLLPYERMAELIEEMGLNSDARPEKQKKILKDLLYGAQKLRKEGGDIIVDGIFVNNGIPENEVAMNRMVTASWLNAKAISHGCKDKIKLEDFLNEVSKLN